MKQLELALSPLTTNERDMRRYMQQVRVNTLCHFLGEHHPKTIAAKHKIP